MDVSGDGRSEHADYGRLYWSENYEIWRVTDLVQEWTVLTRFRKAAISAQNSIWLIYAFESELLEPSVIKDLFEFSVNRIDGDLGVVGPIQ